MGHGEDAGYVLSEDPTAVPAGVARFVAEQLGIAEPLRLRVYAERPKTAYKHQWEIRRECGYHEFPTGEEELREFVAARGWASSKGPAGVVLPGGRMAS